MMGKRAEGSGMEKQMTDRKSGTDSRIDSRIPQEQIMGKGIFLRRMTVEDTEDIVRWRNNPRVRKSFIYQELFTREGHLHWIHAMVDTGRVVQFIICEKSTGRSIGSVYFRDISQEHHRAEYGIFIGEDDAAGRGYGSEACRLALEYGFHVLKLHKIILRVYAENRIALRSYEKNGFQREGYLRDEVFTQGRYHDMILMGIIAPKEEQIRIHSKREAENE